MNTSLLLSSNHSRDPQYYARSTLRENAKVYIWHPALISVFVNFPNSHVVILTPIVVVLGGEAFEKGTLMNEINVLIRGSREPLNPFHPVSIRNMQPGRGPSLTIGASWAQIGSFKNGEWWISVIYKLPSQWHFVTAVWTVWTDWLQSEQTDTTQHIETKII